MGILIALYINNQNEERKELERFNQALVDVEKELETNIFVTRFYINLFGQHDSAYVKLFIDSTEIKDYYYFNGMLTNEPDWVVREESYEKLDKSSKFFGKKDSTLSDLKWLYGGLKNRAKYAEKQLFENINENQEKFESYDWYINWKLNKLDDERIFDFFNNEPDYLKLAAKNFGLYYEYRTALQHYEIQARHLYKSIYEYLNSRNLKHSDSLLDQPNPEEFKHYIGKYNPKWCTEKDFAFFDDSCAVSLENGKFYWNGYYSDRPDSRFEIIPLNRYRFIDDRGWNIYHLEFDAQGEVTGVKFSAEPGFIYYLEKAR